MPWTVIVKQKFSAAHYLEQYQGKCEEIHGHNYLIIVHIKSRRLSQSGITYDFSEIKKYLQSILPDHKCLNDVYNFNPTAENLAKYFYNKIRKKFPVTKVEIWEDENQGSCFETNRK